jgi:hypothetical protein
VLQLCAVLSQLNEHEKALEFSKKASHYARDLSYLTQVLIQSELNSMETQTEYVKNPKTKKRTNSQKSMKTLKRAHSKPISDNSSFDSGSRQGEVLKSERESLERIHTFSLKENKESDPLDKTTRSRGVSNSSRDGSILSNRSCSQYLPEKVKIYSR